MDIRTKMWFKFQPPKISKNVDVSTSPFFPMWRISRLQGALSQRVQPPGAQCSAISKKKREICDTLQLKTYCSKSIGCVFTIGFRMKITTLMILLGPTTGPFAPKTLRRSLVQWERHDWQDTIHDTMKGSDWTIGCAVRRCVYLRMLVKQEFPAADSKQIDAENQNAKKQTLKRTSPKKTLTKRRRLTKKLFCF
jgi:hypothetical protein